MYFEERYAKLNPEQKQAVDAIFGPVVVLAGPGSGKTEILSLRVANILRQTDTDASSVLCLTFTDNAAKNMRKRLLKLIGPDAHRVSIFTFHGFGSFLMQRFPEFFHGGYDFKPADDVTRIQILQNILQRLDIANPLSSYSEAHGFVYERDILSCLSDFRRGGIRPDQFRAVIATMKQFQKEHQEKLLAPFAARVSKDTPAAVQKLVDQLRAEPGESVGLFTSPTIHTAITLEQVLTEVAECGKNTPLSTFKADFFDKDANGDMVVFSEKTIAKWEGLAYVYEEYERDIHEAGWYDFDDMIMETLEQLEKNAELRARVHEQYQFVMVDEYQDTSTAQLQLLLNLLPKEEPNIFVVGDDDQSIYSFQGANIRNLKTFFTLFENTQTVILQTNYRSKPEIVSLGQEIITHSDQRIGDIVPGILKSLVSAHTQKGSIEAIKTDTWDQEQHEVVGRIQTLIESGVAPGEIAVIAREHAQLIDIAAHLQTRQIAVQYDYHANVLEYAPIKLLIAIWRTIHAIQALKPREAEENFFEFIKHESFRIPISDLFHIRNLSIKQKESVFHENVYKQAAPELKDLITSLVHFAQHAIGFSFERVHEGLISTERTQENWPWFAQAFLNTNQNPDIETIFALRTLISTIRKHYQQRFITLEQALGCIDAYEAAGRSISLKVPGHKADHKVHLLTAHGSKGLEYEHVFIVSADDPTWFSHRAHGKISLPFIIPDQYIHDANESVRLLYVAITRAKHALTISRHEFDEKGNELLPARALSLEEVKIEAPLTPHIIGPSLQILQSDEPNILNAALEGFKLTATHVNSFVDILQAGPMHFKWYTLYKFPSPKSYSATYGTLVHAVLTELYRQKFTPEKAQELFTEKLADSSLDPRERERAAHSFQKSFPAFFEQLASHELAQDLSFLLEYPTESHINEVPIRGNLDKVVVAQDTITIVDYKTGSPHTTTKTGTDYQKAKVHKYMRQLQFYFLLLKHDPRVAGKTFTGRIEFFEQDQKGKVVMIDYTPSAEDLEQMTALVERIYACLQNHTFPDVSGYEQTFAGIEQFEQDLLNGKFE